MTVYYVVQYQHDYDHHTGLKDISLYMIQDNKLNTVGIITVYNSENTEEAILDYFGEFNTHIQLVVL